jgi:hypothetical protein
MEADAVKTGMDRGPLWASRVLSGTVVVFLLLDGGMKLFKPAFVVEATEQLGYQASTIIGIGLTLLACTVSYVIPQTTVLGAVLLTGYLGGAVASNVRAATPVFNIVFPIICAGFVWGGLWLRNGTVRQLFPLNRRRG